MTLHDLCIRNGMTLAQFARINGMSRQRLYYHMSRGTESMAVMIMQRYGTSYRQAVRVAEATARYYAERRDDWPPGLARHGRAWQGLHRNNQLQEEMK